MKSRILGSSSTSRMRGPAWPGACSVVFMRVSSFRLARVPWVLAAGPAGDEGRGLGSFPEDPSLAGVRSTHRRVGHTALRKPLQLCHPDGPKTARSGVLESGPEG